MHIYLIFIATLLFILLKAPIAKIKRQSAQQYNLRFKHLHKEHTKHNAMYCIIIKILKEHCSYFFYFALTLNN